MSKFSSKQEIPQEMLSIIKLCAGSMGGVGIWGGLAGAGADLPAIAFTWTGMTVALAKQAGHKMEVQVAKKVTLTIAAGIGTFIGGTKIATTVFGWVAAAFTGGASLLFSVGVNVALNSTLTYAYGRAAARYFLQVEEINNIEVMVKVIFAFMGADLGFDLPGKDLIT